MPIFQLARENVYGEAFVQINLACWSVDNKLIMYSICRFHLDVFNSEQTNVPHNLSQTSRSWKRYVSDYVFTYFTLTASSKIAGFKNSAFLILTFKAVAVFHVSKIRKWGKFCTRIWNFNSTLWWIKDSDKFVGYVMQLLIFTLSDKRQGTM